VSGGYHIAGDFTKVFVLSSYPDKERNSYVVELSADTTDADIVTTGGCALR
jgi:hypothetical protein